MFFVGPGDSECLTMDMFKYLVSCCNGCQMIAITDVEFIEHTRKFGVEEMLELVVESCARHADNLLSSQ